MLGLLYLAFFASLRFSSKRLPAVVTTLQGQRVSRQSYLTSMMFVGLWGPLFPAGLLLVCMVKELTTSLVTYTAWGACALLAIVHCRALENRVGQCAGDSIRLMMAAQET